MSATIIDGKAFAAGLRQRIAVAVADMGSRGIVPGLAVVLVGSDPASEVYVSSKAKMTVEVGMRSYKHVLPAGIGQADLIALVAQLNADPEIDGILVQLPLPDGLDAAPVIAAIDPDKDVDGLTNTNAGRIANGLPGLVPCTPLGSMMLIRSVKPDIAGAEAVVVGRSNLVGKPIAQLLLAANATVTMAHSRTRDLASVCRRADILVAAVGRPQMLGRDFVKPGAVVVDVGINRIPAPEKGEGKTRLVGDVAFEEAAEVASAITPAPGGVGPMTIACLLANTVTAAHLRRGLPPPAF